MRVYRMHFRELIALAANLFEGAGVATMVVGAVLALVRVGYSWARKEARKSAVQRFRHGLGQAILLGLELLVAADIIRTVSEQPTLQGVLILGLIVLIRTFLSFILVVELEGRWPWQRALSERGREPPQGESPTPSPPSS